MTSLLIPYPEIDPVLLQLGPFAIRWYALAYIAGLIIGWRIMRRVCQQPPAILSPEKIDDFLLWVALGVITAIIAYALRNKTSPFMLSDLVAIVVPIGLFFGRIANFINGELWGRASDVPWAMVFPRGGPMPRHPSQLYQAFFEGIVLLAIVSLVWRLTDGRRRPGLLTGVFCAGYGMARITGEFFREPDSFLGFLLGTDWLSMGMVLSLPMVLFGAALIVRAYRRPLLP